MLIAYIECVQQARLRLFRHILQFFQRFQLSQVARYDLFIQFFLLCFLYFDLQVYSIPFHPQKQDSVWQISNFLQFIIKIDQNYSIGFKNNDNYSGKARNQMKLNYDDDPGKQIACESASHKFTQNKERIVRKKLQFLQMQYAHSAMRVSQLSSANQTMATAIAKLKNCNERPSSRKAVKAGKQNERDNAVQHASSQKKPRHRQPTKKIVINLNLKPKCQDSSQLADMAKTHKQQLKNLNQEFQHRICEIRERGEQDQADQQQQVSQLEKIIAQYKVLCEHALERKKTQRKRTSIDGSREKARRGDSSASSSKIHYSRMMESEVFRLNNSGIDQMNSFSQLNPYQNKLRSGSSSKQNLMNGLGFRFYDPRQHQNSKLLIQNSNNSIDLLSKSQSGFYYPQQHQIIETELDDIKYTKSRIKLVPEKSKIRQEFNSNLSSEESQHEQEDILPMQRSMARDRSFGNQSLRHSNSTSLKANKSYAQIVTQIRCEGCSNQFKPNHYYRHLDSCRISQKIRLLKERDSVSEKLQNAFERSLLKLGQ